MTPGRRELYERLVETRAMPEGADRVAATEAVVAEIEASDERSLLPFAYHSLIWAYHRGAELEKSFALFEAELRLYDTEPELFTENEVHRLLWSFKWMTAGLWKFPSISREKIEATIDDMERRYALAIHGLSGRERGVASSGRERGVSPDPGVGMSAVADIRLYYAIHRGDADAAAALYEAAMACGRDALSDCAACTANERGYYQALLGNDAAALELLDTVVVDGLSCATEPHASLGTALLPYMREGRLDDARAAHIKGYRLVRGKLVFQATLAEHIEFLARTGNEARGLDVLAEHASMLTEQDHPLSRLWFLSAAGLLLRRVAPDTVVRGPDGPSTAGEVAAWARVSALDLAEQFDRRNGTSCQTERALAVLDAEPLVRSLRLALGTGRSAVVPADTPLAESALAESGLGAGAPIDVAAAVGGSTEVPIGVTAELIGAEGLDLDALVSHAEALAAMGHPATGPLWQRIAERVGADADRGGPGTERPGTERPGAERPGAAAEAAGAERPDPRLLAKIDDGIGRTISATDPFVSRERLERAVERWSALGDERALAIARSRAAVAAALTGDHDAAVAECVDAGVVLEKLGTPLERLHHLYRRAYIRLATAADAAGRKEAAELFREHVAAARRLDMPADAAQSRLILLDHLEDPAEPSAAATAWHECAQAAREAGREWWLPHICVRLAQARLAAGWFPDQSDQVLAALDDAVRYGDSWGEPRPAAYACYLRGELLGELEQYESARAAAFDAVIRAEDARTDALATEARVLLGTIHHELERDHEAAEYLESALTVLSDADPQLLFRVRYRLGVSLHRLGEVREAATNLELASEIAEQAGVPGSAAHAAHLAGAALEQFEPAAAATSYARAARLFACAEEGQGEVRMYRAQAAALTEAGQFDEALAALERAGVAAEALSPGEDVDPQWERAEVDDQSARVLAMAGRGVEAVHRALSAEQRHVEAGAPADAAHAAALAAQVTLELLEDADAAEPVARRALAHADSADDETAHTSAVLALAAVLDGQGRADEAAKLRAAVGVETNPEDDDDIEIHIDVHPETDDGDDAA